jgi:hypothetical protein
MIIMDGLQGGRMRLPSRMLKGWMCFIAVIVFFAAVAEAQGKVAEEQKNSLDLFDVKACEGVQLTQCELAKDLILTLKMGEDLPCEACFISLQALGIAPGEDWNYADPNKVVTLDEIKEVLQEIHQAYKEGTVRLDGFEAATGINQFCQDIKGPAASAPPPSTSKEEEKKEEGAQQEQRPASSDAHKPAMQQGETK